MGRKRKYRYKKEDGFTLIEVVASIAIMSIILLGVVQLLTFTNKVAESNNSKLVTTHLAKATIERMKIQPETYFNPDELGNYTIDDCLPDQCSDLYQFLVNDQRYDVAIEANQTAEEKVLHLINVVVTVELANKQTKSTVEGYVIHEASE